MHRASGYAFGSIEAWCAPVHECARLHIELYHALQITLSVQLVIASENKCSVGTLRLQRRSWAFDCLPDTRIRIYYFIPISTSISIEP